MASIVTNHKFTYTALSNAVSEKPLADKTVLIIGAGRSVGEYVTHQIAMAAAERIGPAGRDKSGFSQWETNLQKPIIR